MRDGTARAPSGFGIKTVCLALAFLIHAGVAAAAVPVIGDAYSGRIEVAGRQIPLPEGEWRLAALSRETVKVPPEQQAPALFETAVLMRLAGSTVDGFAIIHANLLPLRDGWGDADDCSRTDIHAARIFYSSPHDGFCGFVNHVVTARDAASSAPAWKAALALAGRQGWEMPRTWLMAGFRLSDRRDVVDLRYHLNPATRGFPDAAGDWATSLWSPQRVSEDPARAAAVGQLAQWLEDARPVVERIRKNQVGAESTLPRFGVAAMPAGETDSDGAASTGKLQLTLMKSATYRVVSSSTTFLVSLLFTNSALEAGALTFVNAVSHSVVFFGHELAWQTFGSTGSRPVAEFAGAGTVR